MMSSTKTETRSDWVDYAKGIGIILVVYAHLLSSAYHAGLKIPGQFFALSDSIIYSFHMPLFFFLSGLFVESSLRKRGPRDYLLDKFRRIAYPYFIWSILQVSVEVIFSDQTQRGTGLKDLLAIPYRPWGQFWFIYALFLMHVTYTALAAFGKFSVPITLVIAFGLFFYPIPTGLFALLGFSGHFIFFVAGIYLKKYLVDQKINTIPPGVTLILFVVLIAAGYYLFTEVIEPIRLIGSPYPLYFLILSILGISACIGLAGYFSRRKIFEFLSMLGIYSLQIFLAHMLVGVGTRVILLVLFNIQNWIIHIILGVLAALIFPVILQKVATRIKFPYIFELRRNDRLASDQYPLRGE
ncbi:MAG TPA: acyltransferase [Anaerolineales bacterium]|nr:acyltransferase [Anaerolineales bacterium]HLO31925.1 acyltransferase [Anaerolineales bacterium]